MLAVIDGGCYLVLTQQSAGATTMTNLPNYFPAFDRIANTAEDVYSGRHNNTCIDRREDKLTRHLELLVRDVARTHTVRVYVGDTIWTAASTSRGTWHCRKARRVRDKAMVVIYH